MSIRVEAKTLDLALVRAAGQLGVTQDRMAYAIEEKSVGFLGMFGKKVVIKAWAKNDRGNMKSDRHQRSDRRDEPRREGRGPRPDHRQNSRSHEDLEAGSKSADSKDNGATGERRPRPERGGASSRGEERRPQGRGRRPERKKKR